ncbi:MAG: hypothetical protein J6W46_08535, partial [Spirochaetaceae bacterium]|nr:hypothetical protein [Spirochaetaceae bacterium]
RLATFIGGSSITSFVERILAHFAQFTKREGLQNLYLASGYVTIVDGNSAPLITYTFIANSVEVFWKNNGDINYVLFRGCGHRDWFSAAKMPNALGVYSNGDVKLQMQTKNSSGGIATEILSVTGGNFSNAYLYV